MPDLKNDPMCPHCDPNSFALKHILNITSNFYILCDVHPLVEGHILIIPKQHTPCMGALIPQVYEEFVQSYLFVSRFLKLAYGDYATFEHGLVGQTVFHAHMHLLPFKGDIATIIPEWHKSLHSIKQLKELIDVYKKQHKYLFISLNVNMWLVDVVLGKPRFFRDRFASALGKPERGDWKKVRQRTSILIQMEDEIRNLEYKWSEFCQSQRQKTH